MSATLALRVTGVRASNSQHACRARQELDGHAFEFKAGQAVLLGAAGQERRVPYSIASAPEETAKSGVLEFLMKVDASGDPGPHLRGLARGRSSRGTVRIVRLPDSAIGTAVSVHRRRNGYRTITIDAPARSSRGCQVFAVSYSARTPQDFAYSQSCGAWHVRAKFVSN